MCHLLIVPQVFVAQTNYLPGYGHYLSVWEADGNVQVCLKTNGMITDPLYITQYGSTVYIGIAMVYPH